MTALMMLRKVCLLQSVFYRLSLLQSLSFHSSAEPGSSDSRLLRLVFPDL